MTPELSADTRPASRIPADEPMHQDQKTLDLAGLEDVYDALAEAIDRAGEDRRTRFLVKLALLDARALGDAALVRRNIEAALRDL